jgi:hypothetical protein
MRSPLLLAFFNPANMAMLAFSVAAGLLAAWWLFPIGLVLWVIMMVRIATDRSLRINYDMQARLGTLSPRFQKVYDKVVRSQMRIFTSLLSASGRTRRALAPVQTEVETLTNLVYTVCQQMTAPENYLKVSKMSTDLEGERALLVLSMDGITDAVVKREKEEALRALDSSMQKNKHIAAMLDRVEAQLASLVNILDATLADIIRLQALGGAQAEKQTAPLVQQLRNQIAQLRTFEEEANRAL